MVDWPLAAYALPVSKRFVCRMTKLPPGFTHELPQHLSSPQQSPVDPELGVPVMNFDDFCCGTRVCQSDETSYALSI